MRTILAGQFFFTMLFANYSLIAQQSNPDSIKYTDGQQLLIVGKMHWEKNYQRLPASFANRVRRPVWALSRNSAGISILFRTNSTKIVVRWIVMDDNNLPHMPATGVKGVDLYAWVGDKWQFVNVGVPKSKVNNYTLLSDGDGVVRDYLLNLPLYDGVDSLSIGVNNNAVISKPQHSGLASKSPVVYYGSSIAQGGVASRPGMAFTNIIARQLDRSVINLGFSGNGTFDLSVAEAMAQTKAALYVIDCNPNTREDSVYSGAIRVVRFLKSKHPETPVLLVEGFHTETEEFEQSKNASVDKKRQGLETAYQELQKSGMKGLWYKSGNDLLGSDHEATVDGVHPNDLGMMRIAKALLPVIRSILR
ncbi:MAG TPA: SGNH/GDSL hydrolase family protein [Flavitalea sp.]|nr:SGNH/GDSL hydrolase family protein [Flavitalea sp.]